MKAQGITSVVGLLEDQEVAKYYERPPVEVLTELGLHAVNVPIVNPDAGGGSGDQSNPPAAAAVPTPAEAFERIEKEFAAAEAAGGKVATHCWGGAGRTGKVLAAWLVKRHGLGVEEAAALVESTAKTLGTKRRVNQEQVKQLLGHTE
jgi:hypothetical protein